LASEDDEELRLLGETLDKYSSFPFTHDGRDLMEAGPMPPAGYDVEYFNSESLVGVEFSVLAYNMPPKKPSFSFTMRGIYHLGDAVDNPPTTPSGKRKGNVLVSPRRQKGTAFHADSFNTG
jgi:hypothetical protein